MFQIKQKKQIYIHPINSMILFSMCGALIFYINAIPIGVGGRNFDGKYFYAPKGASLNIERPWGGI